MNLHCDALAIILRPIYGAGRPTTETWKPPSDYRLRVVLFDGTGLGVWIP